MKTSKEFFERLKTDEAFAKEVGEKIAAKREAGAANYYETIIPVAAELDYEVKEEELDAISEAQTSELSEEELGKVSGGGSCLVIVSIASVIGLSVSVMYSMKELSIIMPEDD